YRNLERLLRDAVAAQGWQVELAVVRSPEPFDQLRLNEGAKSFKLAAILHTDEQRHIRVSATDFELGIDHVKVEIKLTPAERGARFSRTSVLGVQHAVRERRDEWTKFEVVDAEGL